MDDLRLILRGVLPWCLFIFLLIYALFLNLFAFMFKYIHIDSLFWGYVKKLYWNIALDRSLEFYLLVRYPYMPIILIICAWVYDWGGAQKTKLRKLYYILILPLYVSIVISTIRWYVGI